MDPTSVHHQTTKQVLSSLKDIQTMREAHPTYDESLGNPAYGSSQQRGRLNSIQETEAQQLEKMFKFIDEGDEDS